MKYVVQNRHKRERDWPRGVDKRSSSVRQREERVGPKTNAGRVSVKYFE